VCAWLSRRWDVGLSDDDVLSALLWGAVGLLVGARVGYELFYGFDRSCAQTRSRFFRVWEGGMSFHGGLVGIIIAGYCCARFNVPFLRSPTWSRSALLIGIFFGRVANFINAELWGRVTDVPWGMVFPGAGPLPRHPSQLYEALLEGVVLLVVMLVLARRKRPDGEMVGWLLTLYGVFRFAIEFVREPDAHLGAVVGPFSMGQVLTLPVFAVGVWLLWRARVSARSDGGEA
jgi:phosphatidylglycerol---prolipoprotein diacylglyceryl transferase